MFFPLARLRRHQAPAPHKAATDPSIIVPGSGTPISSNLGFAGKGGEKLPFTSLYPKLENPEM